MSNIIFNEHQRRQIEANPHVISVSDRSIQYTAEFKLKAVQEKLNGKGPYEIFKDAGFDLELIGVSKVQSAIYRWKKPINYMVIKDLQKNVVEKEVRGAHGQKTYQLIKN